MYKVVHIQYTGPVHESDEAEETSYCSQRGREESEGSWQVELDLEGEIWCQLPGATLLLHQPWNGPSLHLKLRLGEMLSKQVDKHSYYRKSFYKIINKI